MRESNSKEIKLLTEYIIKKNSKTDGSNIHFRCDQD